MGAIKYSKRKDHALIFQGIKNTKSKEKQIVKEKKPKSKIEDESSKPIDEDSMKKINNKRDHIQVLLFQQGIPSIEEMFQ